MPKVDNKLKNIAYDNLKYQQAYTRVTMVVYRKAHL